MLALALLGLLAIQDQDIESLLKQLEDESIEVRDKAALKLIDLGDKAEEKVKARLASAEGELKHICKRILEQMAVPKKLRGVLPPLRKVSIEAKERSLKETLEDLRQQGGIPLDLERLADGTVTVSFRDLMPLEALEAVCKAANLGYTIDQQYGYSGMVKARAMPAAGGPGGPGGFGGGGGEAKIRFQPGQYFEAPRHFVRHYVVEPTNLTLTRSNNFRSSNTNASLSLRVMWPPDVKPATGTITVGIVMDDKGRSLVQVAPRMGKYSGGSNPLYGPLHSSVQITYPEADAKSLARVAGTVTLKYMLEEKIIAFESPEGAEPQKKELAGLTVEFQECKVADGQATVRVTLSGGEKLNELRNSYYHNQIRLKLENGTYAASGGSSMSGGGDSMTCQMHFTVAGKVAAVEVVAETIYHTDTFDYELKDIVLPK